MKSFEGEERKRAGGLFLPAFSAGVAKFRKEPADHEIGIEGFEEFAEEAAAGVEAEEAFLASLEKVRHHAASAAEGFFLRAVEDPVEEFPEVFSHFLEEGGIDGRGLEHLSVEDGVRIGFADGIQEVSRGFVVVGVDEGFGVEVAGDKGIAPVNGKASGDEGVGEFFGGVAPVAGVFEGQVEFKPPEEADFIQNGPAGVVQVKAAGGHRFVCGKQVKEAVAEGMSVRVAVDETAEVAPEERVISRGGGVFGGVAIPNRGQEFFQGAGFKKSVVRFSLGVPDHLPVEEPFGKPEVAIPEIQEVAAEGVIAKVKIRKNRLGGNENADAPVVEVAVGLPAI